MKIWRVLGYIGIVIVLSLTIFLIVKYYQSTDKEIEYDEGFSKEIVAYQKLVCSGSTSSDDYTINNTISMSFQENELVWIYDNYDYIYKDRDTYNQNKELLTQEESSFKYSYQDDYLIISRLCEGEYDNVLNNCLSITDTNYSTLSEYYKSKGYNCGE